MCNNLYSKLKNSIYIFFNRLMRKCITTLMAKIAATGNGSDQCLKQGFLPVPVNYYSPIPDIEDLTERNIWNIKSNMVGIDLREDAQIGLLKVFAEKYNNECNWPLFPTQNSNEFYTENDSFGGGCASITHSFIRHFKPERVFEIGSGMSSLIIDKAIKLNDSEAKRESIYTIIDPYPSDSVKKKMVIANLIEKRVEVLELSFFECLEENDILFIDSGHSVRIGGDVNFMYLEVLPRLTPGVIVHIHDIRLPYEYSERLAKNETFRQFWTEQYILQSFLCFNSDFEILMACNFLMVDYKNDFLKSFPRCSLGAHPSSFWIRRKVDVP
ncbi:class I SAM-dependent methyltransferase [Thermodesulfobacteriota bacterium]